MTEYELEKVKFNDRLLELDVNFNTTYEYAGIPVPRVTKILDYCSDQSGLINWGASVGKMMYKIKNKATTVGSNVHEMIDNYLNYVTGKSKIEDMDLNGFLSNDYLDEIYNAYNHFKEWLADFNAHGFRIEEVVGLEVPVVCPWFGGTIDAIVKINGYYYILDFKTSKQISTEYFLQVSAYMWMVNNGYGDNLPHINGVGIIRVSKTFDGFESIFLNEFDPYQNYVINQYQMTFASFVDSYYRAYYAHHLKKDYMENYNISNIKGNEQ